MLGNRPDAFYRHYRTVQKTDVHLHKVRWAINTSCAKKVVYRLDTDGDEIESLDLDLVSFLEEVQADPIAFLNLER